MTAVVLGKLEAEIRIHNQREARLLMAQAQSTWELLRTLGFSSDRAVVSDPPGGLSMDFGNVKLTASVCISLRFQPIILLGGVLRTPRTIAEVSCEMPRSVESFEQGVAWITWCLDEHSHGQFQPTVPVGWLIMGRQFRHLLPWERQMAAYEARPVCLVDREWARVALRKLAEEISRSDDDTAIGLHFDGEILRIHCPSGLIAVPASGKPWESHYAIRTGVIRRLPKRLMGPTVAFSIWDSALKIERRVYPGVLAEEQQ